MTEEQRYRIIDQGASCPNCREPLSTCTCRPSERAIAAASQDPAFKRAAKPKRIKPKSRAARWSEAASNAAAALSDLVSIQEEFQSWLDNLPENLQSSALGDKLTTVCDLDLQGALDSVNEAEGADLPLGFGRD